MKAYCLLAIVKFIIDTNELRLDDIFRILCQQNICFIETSKKVSVSDKIKNLE